MTRLTLRDQLDLQEAVSLSARGDWRTASFHFSTSGELVAQVLQRHGVAVSLDEHTGRVTFNPEVVEA